LPKNRDRQKGYSEDARYYTTKPINGGTHTKMQLLRLNVSVVTSFDEFWFGLARLPREEER
jgi:hypothetical protein